MPHLVILIFGALVICCAILFLVVDMFGRVDYLKQNVPWLERILKKRSALTGLVLVTVFLLVGDAYELFLKEIPEVQEPPIVKIAPPRPPIIDKNQPNRQPTKGPVIKPPASSLAPFTDGQRFLLKKRLPSYKGHSVLIVLVGQNPQGRVVFEQLLDVFSGWKIEQLEIGAMSVAGTANPVGSYMTGADISGQLVKDTFSAFSSSGVDLPLTPNSIPQWQIIELVIVIKGDNS